MSHHYVAVTDIPAGGETLKTDKIASIQSLCLMIGGIGAVISAILLLPQIFSEGAQDSLGRSYAFSWLFGFEVFFTITVGMLFWVLLHNASNSGWGVAIRRIPEAISNNFGLMFFLGLPLIFIPSVRETVWTWIGHHDTISKTVDAGPDATLYDQIHAGGHATHLLAHKFGYLHLGWGTIPGFDLRYVIYFAILGFGAWQMRQYSISQDATGNVKTTFSARRFAAGWLPLMAIASSFASIDWIEGLDYKWFSTMWPVNVFAGSAMSSMALIILVVGMLVKTGHLKHIVSAEHFHIKGKLMHAFIIFWAYICFSQYFLIWYANIPEETRFFAIRNTGGYWYLSLALTFLHFVVPFVALLKRDSKKNLNAIMIIAVYVIFIHVLEVFWWVTPQRGPVLYDASSAPTFGRLILDFGMDLMALATIGGLYGYCFLKRLAKASIYPCGDPRLEESVNLMN
jgi:hypothetical protein